MWAVVFPSENSESSRRGRRTREISAPRYGLSQRKRWVAGAQAEAQRPESLEELGEASQRRRLEFGPKGSVGISQGELGVYPREQVRARTVLKGPTCQGQVTFSVVCYVRSSRDEDKLGTRARLGKVFVVYRDEEYERLPK